MRTVSLGRKLGDWLGIVPDDDSAWSESPVRPEGTVRIDDARPARAFAPVEPVRAETARAENARVEPAPTVVTPIAARTARIRRIAPTAEFRAEVVALRQAVHELLDGLDAADVDER